MVGGDDVWVIVPDVETVGVGVAVGVSVDVSPWSRQLPDDGWLLSSPEYDAIQ